MSSNTTPTRLYYSPVIMVDVTITTLSGSFDVNTSGGVKKPKEGSWQNYLPFNLQTLKQDARHMSMRF